MFNNFSVDLLEISFLWTSFGSTYIADILDSNDDDKLVPYVLAFDEPISLKSSDFENIDYFSVCK